MAAEPSPPDFLIPPTQKKKYYIKQGPCRCRCRCRRRSRRRCRCRWCCRCCRWCCWCCWGCCWGCCSSINSCCMSHSIPGKHTWTSRTWGSCWGAQKYHTWQVSMTDKSPRAIHCVTHRAGSETHWPAGTFTPTSVHPWRATGSK